MLLNVLKSFFFQQKSGVVPAYVLFLEVTYFSSITNKSNTEISIEALLIDVIVLASEVESRGWGVWGLKIFMHDLFFNYTFLFFIFVSFYEFFHLKNKGMFGN